MDQLAPFGYNLYVNISWYAAVLHKFRNDFATCL
jgi:hypothetical protein